MGFAPSDLSDDRFLNGKVKLLQPLKGYRAATDPVFLAAAVPATAGQSVLELGCGAGVAIACLCARVPGLCAVGLEIQPNYADLATVNFARNNLNIDVQTGDLTAPPEPIKSRVFDFVMMNPPFYSKNSVSVPVDQGRKIAHIEGEAGLDGWIDAGLRRTRQGGWLAIIHQAERLDDMLTGISAKAGNIHVLPLVSRAGRPAKRVIILAEKASKSPLKLLSPLVIHSGDSHVQGQADYSDAARLVLRDGHGLGLINQILEK